MVSSFNIILFGKIIFITVVSVVIIFMFLDEIKDFIKKIRKNNEGG